MFSLPPSGHKNGGWDSKGHPFLKMVKVNVTGGEYQIEELKTPDVEKVKEKT